MTQPAAHPAPTPRPAGCLCPFPDAAACQMMRQVAARYFGEKEPEEERCPCPCHTQEERP